MFLEDKQHGERREAVCIDCGTPLTAEEVQYYGERCEMCAEEAFQRVARRKVKC